MSSRARRRHERGLERAEEIVDRTAVKVAKSKKSASNISVRKKNWDEINSSAGTVRSSQNMFGALGGEDEEGEESVEEVDEFDEEMEVVQEASPAVVAEAKGAVASAPDLAKQPVEDEDEEIL